MNFRKLFIAVPVILIITGFVLYVNKLHGIKDNISVEAYLGKNAGEELVQDFNFYNAKLEKYFSGRDIKFKIINSNDENEAGYIIHIGNKKYVFNGILTDTDLIGKINELKKKK